METRRFLSLALLSPLLSLAQPAADNSSDVAGKSGPYAWPYLVIAVLIGVIVILTAVIRRQRHLGHDTKNTSDPHHDQVAPAPPQTDNFKSRFFAHVAHEFRTPLSLVIGPLDEALKKKSPTESNHELLSLAKRNAAALSELVNQLHDLSRLEAGKMELRVRPGDLESMLKVIAASFDSWAENKGIVFEKQIHHSGQRAWYDRDKLEKIITYLLANTFRITPTGEKIGFEAHINHEHTTLTIGISASGVEISREDIETSFSFQAISATVANREGTGLRLLLMNELVKLYGGTVRLQTIPDGETRFQVDIPVGKSCFTDAQIFSEEILAHEQPEGPRYFASEELLSEEHELSQDGKDSILIAEDNSELRNFITSVLAPSYSVIPAKDGREAFRLATGVVPSLVLTDVMMPGMDGMELTEKLKADERTSHIPVIMLTARNEQPARLEGLKTGADDYLTKPFSTDELLVRITNLIEQRRQLAQRFRERILVSATPVNENSHDEKFLQKVRDSVESAMSDLSFSVEILADEMNLSRTQLLRKLKALTGLSPSEFIKDLRLKRAADMIRGKVDTITQIGYAVGFNDQSYFTKCFKKEFGLTPTEYSAKYSGKPDGINS